MKALIGLFAFIAAVTLAPRAARAEVPQIPDTIQSADICSYYTWTSELTCRDAEGNGLIRHVRLFKEFRWTPYPALPVFSAMKRLGFEGKTISKIGDNTQIIFTRPVSCR